MRDQISKYVQLLETNYNQTIRDLKNTLEREKTKAKKASYEKVSETTTKGDLENLFVECIEETRKSIMKRRLKNEILNSKKLEKIDHNSQEAKEFEQSLLKLAEMAKNRVKVQDFTPKDKTNLLELFVNNEKTLLRIYEILFPHRAGPNAGQGVSSSMVVESGAGIYGQNAIRALSRGTNGGSNRQSETAGSMRLTQQNNMILNQIMNKPLDYEAEMMRVGGFMPNQHLPNIMQNQKQATMHPMIHSNSKQHLMNNN